MLPTKPMTEEILFGILKAAFYLGIPLVAVYHICKTRRRDPIKGLVVMLLCTFIPFMNWIAMFLLWLGLRRKDEAGRIM